MPAIDLPALHQRLQPFFTQPEIQLVILFGSTATGRGHAASDLDLAVCADRPLDTAAATAELMRLLHVNEIDLVDLRRASPLLAYEIARTGRVIYARAPGIHAEFVSLAVRRFIDTRKLRDARRCVIEQFLAKRGAP